MEFSSGIDLLKLAELLKPPEEEIKQEDDLPKAGYKIERHSVPRQRKELYEKSDAPKTIEEYEIQQEMDVSETLLDGKKEVSYDIKYRQAVTPEDMFLQMSGKTPATASCEDMVLSIHLPGETMTSLNLEVSKTEVKAIGFSNRFDLALPHPIDPDLSKANWDQKEELLILTLRMTREFDFVNF